jgi:kexin
MQPPASTHDHIDGNPTDHIHRPTKPGSKPTPTQEDSAASTAVDQEPATSSQSSHWVSWLPSFGASKKAQIWIYGAIGLIAAFCSGLGIYFFIARRRRLRNDSRNTYEFELIDEEEGDAMNGGAEKGLVSGKKGRRTRGGELYDAFADGSDDDEEFNAYRDRSASRLAGIDDASHDREDEDEEQHVIGEESDDDDESYGRGGESKPLGGPSS